jgi:MFS family permease
VTGAQKKAARRRSGARVWPDAPAVVLALLCLLYLVLFVNRVNLATVAPLLKADLVLSNTQVGLAFSAFAIPYAVLQLAGGWIGDRFGPRLVLSVCCAVVAFSTVLTSATGGFASLFLLRVVLGLGEGPAFPAATRAMSRWTRVENWGFAQGVTHSFSRMGNAVSPPLVAGLLVFVSWRGSFVILGLASLVWLLVWAWYFRDDPHAHHGITPADLQRLPQTHGKERIPVPWLPLARRMLPLTVTDFCYGWTLWLFLSWIPSFFFENYHLNLQASALFSGGVLLGGVVGDTVGGIASDRLLRRTGSLRQARCSVMVTGFLGTFVFLLPVILVHDLTVAALGLALAFFFAELIVAPIWSVPMDIAPRFAGSASGMMNFGFGLAGLVSPSSFGYMVDLTGSWVFPFAGSMALLLAGAVLAARLRPDEPLEEMAGSG